MGQMILVNQYRGTSNTPLNTKPIPMQKDQMQWKEAADLGGGSPFYSYWLRTMQGVGTLSILNQDLLQDAVTGEKFRVFGQPFVYQQSYIKVPCQMMRGT